MNEVPRRTSYPRKNLSRRSVLLLFALLILPISACIRLADWFDPRWIAIYALTISGATLWLYRHDKGQAQSEGWRTPESTLHLFELLGGWPGAFLGQRLFRHKISKTRYQVIFWTTVLIYQIVAFDFLYDWANLRGAFVSMKE